MSAPVDVGAVLEKTSAGLWSVANNCARSNLATTMRERAEEFDLTRAAVAEFFRGVGHIAYALEQDGRTVDGITKEGAAQCLRAALARVGGA